MKRALILGAGFSGCTVAQQLQAQGGWEVLLVEAGAQVGAASRTQWRGDHAFTEGPRYFVHGGGSAFTYLNSMLPMRSLGKRPLGIVLEKNGVYGDVLQGSQESQLLRRQWLLAAAETLHHGSLEESLDPAAKAVLDPRPMAYPEARTGYDDFFSFCTQAATVITGASLERIDLERKDVWLDGQKLNFDVIINCDPIDDLFGQCYGRLRYVGMQHTALVLPVERVLPDQVYCAYHFEPGIMSRTIEYKSFGPQGCGSTLIGIERPVLQGRTHPLPLARDKHLARRYADELPEGVYSIGRLGRYRSSMGISGEICDGLEVCRQLDSRLAA